ncbi:MAG: ATP-binding cassette domain-containing protein [Erythrobacter sp.]
MSAEAPEIAVQGLTMAYGENVIQRGLEFNISKGEIFVIMGDSGSGKSTLLKHLIGLNRPAKGTIAYSGLDFWNSDAKAQLQTTHRFGVLYQSGALWSSMTLAENIALPLQTFAEFSESEVADIVSFKLSLVGLAGFEDYYPSEISGGMKKRAGLARAMALDPEILFFDEPSAGLDPISSRRLDDLILELRDGLGTTVVIVTHELASIFAIGDRGIFVDADAKTQTALGPIAEMRSAPPTEKVAEFLSRGEAETNEGTKP